jgi:hypothetical protein
MVNETRIIPLMAGRTRMPDPVLHGDARGHFEGNTLVVETTNFNPSRGASEQLELVEKSADRATTRLVVNIRGFAHVTRP